MGYAFLSTLSLRRATPAAERLPRCRRNFYPRSPCGERHLIAVSRPHGGDFYPRSPCGERRPAGSVRAARRGGFLSTLSLRRATVLPEASPCTGRDFYPRSPCGERPRPRRRRRRGCYFYPRSPCGERRSSSRSWVVVFLFLSTLSLRRATQTNTGSNESGEFLSTLSLRRATNSLVRCSCTIDISIHALLAESDAWPVGISHHRRISIHALLAESDTSPAAAPFRLSTFLSTLSLRRATAQAWPVLPAGCHFYPRSPCGERPEAIKPS